VLHAGQRGAVILEPAAISAAAQTPPAPPIACCG
jgi:hypothetical protein